MEHHVYFWLGEDHQNADDRAAFETGLDSLTKLNGVKRGLWSVPAKVAPRPVVDLSWDYALSISFEDVAAHDAYQIDPVHQVFIDSFKPWWSKVLVMDLA
jgi:hypothetical protein